MEYKNLGLILLAVSILVIIFTFMYSNVVDEAVRTSCFAQHGNVESCEMFDSVTKQKYYALGIAGILLIASIVLICAKPKEKIIIKKVKEKKPEKKVDLSSFRPEEKQVYNLVKESNAIFQADLIEKTGFSKARMTRIVDKLEGAGIVERKRRGMTNVVVLTEE